MDMRYAAPLFASILPLAFASSSFAQVSEIEFGKRLSSSAIERTHHSVTYDPAYVRLDYPGGDVAPDKGVCADVVIRALRTLDIDLQKLIHEDMKAHFDAYPKRWGLKRTDRNIDHRRVPNIETYLSRHGMRLPPSENPSDYQAGDIIAWNLSGHGRGWMPHIGIVTDQKAHDGAPLIVHNIGAGPQLESVLFHWPITGHYRPIQSQF